jgi:NADH-quinone oxidoreductase subunit C
MKLIEIIKNYVEKVIIIVEKEQYIYIKGKAVEKVLQICKTMTGSKLAQLMDIVGMDNIKNELRRFEINYNLLSIKYNIRLNIVCNISEEESLKSITNIFKSGEWLEREIWDMYGIYFIDNKDLRRILTDYGFEGYPLRKDFPVSGYVELKYNVEEKKIKINLIEMIQIYRKRTFMSPWE